MAGLIDFYLKRQQEQAAPFQLATAREGALRALQQYSGLVPQQGPTRPGESLGMIQNTNPQEAFQQKLQGLTGLLTNPATQQVGQQILQQQFAPEQQKFSGPIQQYMEALQLGLIPQGTSFMDYMRSKAISVNVGTEKPLADKAANWTNAQGQNPPATMSVSQAVDSGFMPKTTEQIKSVQAASEAAPMMGRVAEWGFGGEGEKSLFPPSTQGAFQRGVGGITTYLQGVAGSNERAALYNNTKEALMAGLARLSGQTGNLTDTDLKTVDKLFPIAGFTPEPLAREQFKTIANLLSSKGVPKSKLKELGFPEWTISLDAPTPKGVPKGASPIGTDPRTGKTVYEKDGKRYIPD